MIFKTVTQFQRANERDLIRNGVFFCSETLLIRELLLLNLFTDKSFTYIYYFPTIIFSLIQLCKSVLTFPASLASSSLNSKICPILFSPIFQLVQLHIWFHSSIAVHFFSISEMPIIRTDLQTLSWSHLLFIFRSFS